MRHFILPLEFQSHVFFTDDTWYMVTCPEKTGYRLILATGKDFGYNVYIYGSSGNLSWGATDLLEY